MGLNGILFVTVVCAAITTVVSLRCYVCNTENTASPVEAQWCREGNANITAESCETQLKFTGVHDGIRRFNDKYNETSEFTCAHYTFKGKNAGANDPSTVIRACLRNTGDVCDTLTGFHELLGNKFDSCELCNDQDLCNKSAATAIGPIAMALAVSMFMVSML